MTTRTCYLNYKTVPAGITLADVQRTLQRATLAWQAGVPELRLRWVDILRGPRDPRPGDIQFTFAKMPQGNDEALAVSMPYGEGMHLIVFSTAEKWQAAPQAGFLAGLKRMFARGKRDLLTTALHEIGHALGLDHNEEWDSVMHIHAESEGLIDRPSKRDAARVRRILVSCLVAGCLGFLDFKGGLSISAPTGRKIAERATAPLARACNGPANASGTKKGGSV